MVVGLPKNSLQQYEHQARIATQEFMAAYQAELKPVFADLRSGDVFRTEVGLSSLHNLLIDHFGPVEDGETVAPACGVAAFGCVVYLGAVWHMGAAITAVVVVAAGVWLVGAKYTEVVLDKDGNSIETRAAYERFVLDVMELGTSR